tara:strand:+ start:468 stop:743 length:276 start_codon:yes stop_codon:yes gene_type:complete
MKEVFRIIKAINEGKCLKQDKPITKQSKYVGVCWNIRSNKWRASIYHKSKIIYVGDFKNDREAYEAIKKKRVELKIPYKHNNEVKKLKNLK